VIHAKAFVELLAAGGGESPAEATQPSPAAAGDVEGSVWEEEEVSSIYLSIHPSMCVSIDPFIDPSFYLLIHPSTHGREHVGGGGKLYLSTYISVHPYINR